MGNCIRLQAAVSWAEEDDEEEWEWEDAGHGGVKMEATHGRQLGEKGGRRVLPAATEVKIKITKKQLRELLRRAQAQGVPLQQVLTHLMSGACDVDALHDRARHWRPALQSIPEAAESYLQI